MALSLHTNCQARVGLRVIVGSGSLEICKTLGFPHLDFVSLRISYRANLHIFQS